MIMSDRPIARAITLVAALGFGLTGCSFHFGSSSSSNKPGSSGKTINNGSSSGKSTSKTKSSTKSKSSKSATKSSTKSATKSKGSASKSTTKASGSDTVAPKRTKPEEDGPRRVKADPPARSGSKAPARSGGSDAPARSGSSDAPVRSGGTATKTSGSYTPAKKKSDPKAGGNTIQRPN